MFEVQTYTLCGWVNCWTDLGKDDENSKPTQFETLELAQADLDQYLEDVKLAVEAGDMAEGYSRDDFRIVEVS